MDGFLVRQATVMVVEDDLDLREMIEMLLTVEGLRPVGATNGREALCALHGKEPHPDVILLDLMMPEMNGWQFREAQLSEPDLADIPVIVMSALSERAIEGVPFIQKPFDTDQLMAAIHRAVPAGKA
jgi:CheY-like chemotaxis protein